MKRIHKFITEYEVNDYKSLTNDEIKKGILNYGSGFGIGLKGPCIYYDDITDEKFIKEKMKIDFRKMFGVPEGDLDVLLEQFREEGFTKYYRAGNWRHSFTQVLCNDGKIDGYSIWTTFFRYINKWNQESELQEYKIIVGKKSKIMWINDNSLYDKQYFISNGENIYELSFWGKGISLSQSVFFPDEYFYDDIYDNYEKNDQLIEKFRLKQAIDNKSVSLPIVDEYFEKRFFYKGPKHTRYFEFMHSSRHDTTKLSSIQVKNNLFYLEIENITYPHFGYILLDINEMRIVEAGRLET